MSRPKITLKLATSLDGKIALSNGDSQWVTSEASRAHGRYLRAENDAIAVGANTAELDNPRLTSRVPGQKNPTRIVYDTTLRLSMSSNIVTSANETPSWVFTRGGECEKSEALRAVGVKVHAVTDQDGLSLTESLDIMGQGGIRSLLVEGGGMLIASFVRAGLFDTIHWYRAPVLLGGDGRDCVGTLSLTNMGQAVRLHRMKVSTVGQDLHEIYVKKD
ncbi:RibD family protein [Litorimonas sp. WD9-15]|uniref:RibD family protein n=1 Tax=Litorimonas sp. WD9-15 TaxID=3418716 RepID=UPI003D085C02